MKLTHAVPFEFDLSLGVQSAISFVQDAETSLSRASFIRDMKVTPVAPGDDASFVRASIPINAALFGQQTLSFQSLLEPTPRGARLVALPFEEDKMGWAEVAGEATVYPLPHGTRVTYHFDITIHLDLPEPEKWGGRALTKMIQFTAQQVLERIAGEFPKAVQAAAAEVEAKYSSI